MYLSIAGAQHSLEHGDVHEPEVGISFFSAVPHFMPISRKYVTSRSWKYLPPWAR
jgi:hypothetical protein